MKRIIFHIDMDAFFTSVEQRDNPDYKGKPVIVGSKPGTRGVVSAASYEARKFGVHSALPINEAYRKCPNGIFLPPRMEVYSHVSHSIMEILESFSPVIEIISIDEAFLDMTGTDRLFGAPFEAAEKISNRIRKEQNLTASIGVAPNKFLAKIASDFRKPCGITVCPFDNEEIVKWLAPLKVDKIWGVGKKTAQVFKGMGIDTVADLQKLQPEMLERRFGKQGLSLYNLCRGIDYRPVEAGEPAKSISREHTFNVDSSDKDEWRKTLFMLAQDVARRARSSGVKGNTVVLTYRRPDFSRHSKRKHLVSPTNVAKTIYESGIDILDNLNERSLRLIGIGITGLDNQSQIDLFEAGNDLVLEISEQTVDSIIARFGPEVIAKGKEIELRNGKNKTK
jgi:DNA polymerase-4